MRTAMVGGAGYMAGKKIQQGREAQAAPAEAPVQQAPVQSAQAGITDDTVEQLERLSALKEKGILTDEEFAAQKQKLLASS